MHSDSILLNGADDSRRALLILLAGARRSLHLYTPAVDPRLYDHPEVLAAVRGQVTAQPRIRMYWLLPPAAGWRTTCPHLVELTERLTSAIQLRTLPANEPRERPEFAEALMIADRRMVLHLVDPRGLVGDFQPSGSPATQRLLNFFLEIWEKGRPDPDLRRLHL